MCGIAVSVDVAGRGRSRPWALPHIRHRGPDGEGVVVEGDVVLEHCRLAIIDPDNAAAAQPFADPSGRWLLVYNGEIFNFAELRSELERSGVRFETRSDTEVLLHAYLRDGVAILPRLRGMFAFVVWDRVTGDLFAARDQLGVKPLYYWYRDGLFVAASELRTVVRHPAVRAGLDAESVVEYLAFGFSTGDRTIVDGVQKLLPAHALTLRAGKLDTLRYWDVLAGPARNGAAPEVALRDLLGEAVSAALVSDVPVGMMLSGGLDSSTIAALAARSDTPSELIAYSVGFGLPSDETAAAARLARDLGIAHSSVTLTEQGLEDDFDAWLAEIDVPSADPTWVAISAVARAARRDGTKVLLSGDGGDELFGGYDRWMRYLRFHDRVWRRVPRPVRALGGRAVAPLARGLAGDIARRAADGGDLFVGSRPMHDDDLARFLGPVGKEAAQAVPPETALGRLRKEFDASRPGADYLTWMSYIALGRHLVEDYLTRLDRMTMRESVEGRVPLLDPEVVRFALTLSQDELVDGYRQKELFRRAVAPLLPGYVLARPKQGFCPPVAAWATRLLGRRDGLGRRLVEEGLLAPGTPPHLRGYALWTVGTLDAWCEANL